MQSREDEVPTTVRMSREFRDELKIRAIRNKRTFNAEALLLIEAGLQQIDGPAQTEAATNG